MSILCGSCHNPHDTVDDVKVCYGLLPRQPVVPYRPHPPFIPATARQVTYAVDLGGDESKARQLSKEACSRYIDELKRGAGVNSPSVAPAQSDPKLDMFHNLFASLPDGRYAIRQDETFPFVFLRVKRHTRGKLTGCATIQTQHSEQLKRAAVQWRSGQWYFEQPKNFVLDNMLLVCIDPKTAGHNYASELGRCCICGKELTDERSRWYGIGPDCETRHHSIIEWVDETKNMTFEQARARLFS